MKAKVEKQKPLRGPHYARRAWSWTAYVISTGIQALMIQQIIYYLTESVMLSATTASAIVAVSKLFDGISDLIAGVIIDKTRTRWGTARPYSLFSILMWVAVVLMFSVPDMPQTGKVIYVFIMYNLSETVANTMLLASQTVHLKKGYMVEEQTSVTSFAGFIAGIVSLICSIILPFMIKAFGTQEHGWTLISLVFAVPCLVLSLLKFFFVPEDYDTVIEKPQKISLSVIIKGIAGNKFLLMYLLTFFINRVVSSFGITNYYFQYIVGDLNLAGIVSACAILGMFITPFIPTLERKLGIRKTLMIFQIGGGLGMLLMFLAPHNPLVLGFGMAMNSVGGMPLMMLASIVVIQCMKYSEWKSGARIDGIVASTNGFITKLGNALGVLISGFLLSLTGYDGALAVQPDATLGMLQFLYIAGPAIGMILCGIIMRFYTLEKQLPQIEEELKIRNSNTAEE